MYYIVMFYVALNGQTGIDIEATPYRNREACITEAQQLFDDVNEHFKFLALDCKRLPTRDI